MSASAQSRPFARSRVVLVPTSLSHVNCTESAELYAYQHRFRIVRNLMRENIFPDDNALPGRVDTKSTCHVVK